MKYPISGIELLTKGLEMAKHVTVTLKNENYETALTNGRHYLTGDEPVDLGGGDRGPAPYELLLMSLGSCSVVTMKMYAQRKGYEIEHLEMKLTHHKETRDSDSGTSVKVDVIHKKVQLKGNFTQEQRERILQISSMCPVHRILESAIEIKTEFA